MADWVALLRAVNVGGHGGLAMADLRAELARSGFEGAQTLLASGNIVFRRRERSGAKLEGALEALLASRFGLTTDVIVRASAEWSALIRSNPFPSAANSDPAHLVAMCLKSEPTGGASESLRAAVRGRESTSVLGKTAYLVYPDGIGTSKLTITVIERALGTRGTARNWNTVLKLHGLLPP